MTKSSARIDAGKTHQDRSTAVRSDERSAAGRSDERSTAGRADDRNAAGRADDRSGEASQDTAELRGSPLPPELAAMEDEEVAETVREAFRAEVGEELEDIRIVCCDGVVTLAGEVANEALPAVARRIVEDELGFAVVDRMLVIDTAGGPDREVEDAAPARQVPEETLELDDEELEGEVSEDILETEEQGLVFVPPTRPVPER